MKISFYRKQNGSSPFLEWLDSLERRNQAIVETRLYRVSLGNLGDYKSVGKKIYELRIHHAGGLRVYFSLISKDHLLILCGGNKSSQNRDIKTAKRQLADYLME